MHSCDGLAHEQESHTDSAAAESQADFCWTGMLLIDKILQMPHPFCVCLLNISSNLIMSLATNKTIAHNFSSKSADSVSDYIWEWFTLPCMWLKWGYNPLHNDVIITAFTEYHPYRPFTVDLKHKLPWVQSRSLNWELIALGVKRGAGPSKRSRQWGGEDDS